MIGRVRVSELLKQLPECKGNCPRVYPVITKEDLEEDEEDDKEVSDKKKVPEEYASAVGQKVALVKEEPCYLLFRIARSSSRKLRNYFVANSSRLEVISGEYCGIAPQVYNVKNSSTEPNLALGLLRFTKTDQAYTFVIKETKMNTDSFVDNNWDIWNLTMCAADESIVPNRNNPEKYVNEKNVFFLVHIVKIDKEPQDGQEISQAERQKRQQLVAEEKRMLEEHLDTVPQCSGRIVVKTGVAQRIRGRPQRVENQKERDSVPQKFVYLTQWPGVAHFWRWYEGDNGRSFVNRLKLYTGGNYQTHLFTACLDFQDVD